jgi:glutamate-1-semialdehyde 2,1-aminomutase
VYQAGTLSGNPLAVTAGLATLKGIRDVAGAYDRLEALGALAEAAFRKALDAGGVRGCVQRVGSMLTLFFGIDEARDYPTVSKADTAAFGRFFRGMLDEGMYLPPSQFEAMFVSLAHQEADLDRLAFAARRVLAGG